MTSTKTKSNSPYRWISLVNIERGINGWSAYHRVILIQIRRGSNYLGLAMGIKQADRFVILTANVDIFSGSKAIIQY